MPVTLQVVGLYYKQALDIEIEPGHKISVKDVLEYAKGRTIGGALFTYSPGKGAQQDYVNFMMTSFAKEFESPVSKTKYLPGSFLLQQTFTKIEPGNYTVWQYYVLDRDGKSVHLSSREMPFTKAVVVEDGYTVIWRLVEICGARRVPKIAPDATQNIALVADILPDVNARLAKVLGIATAKS